MFSCATPKPAAQAPVVASVLQPFVSSSGLRLTTIGKNRGGRLSSDGTRVLFLSSEREAHRNWQLYELNLENYRERRITFQDGDCLEAEYSPGGEHFLYASTTDEIKERPALLRPIKGERPPTDLYLSDLKGMQIERLTEQAGYQGQPSWVSSGQVLLTSELSNSLQIESLLLASRHRSVWQADPHASLELPTVDGTGSRVAWVIRKKEATLSLGLKNKGHVQTTVVPFTEVQSLQWISGPQKEPLLLMSAKNKNDPYLKAWVLDPEKKCATILFEEPGPIKDLRASARLEKLLYTYESLGSSQLYLREFPPLPASCDSLRGQPVQPQMLVGPAPAKQEAPHLIKAEVPQNSDSPRTVVDPQGHPKTPSNSGE